jgi:hypothetical protein
MKDGDTAMAALTEYRAAGAGMSGKLIRNAMRHANPGMALCTPNPASTGRLRSAAALEIGPSRRRSSSSRSAAPFSLGEHLSQGLPLILC